jgi:hypothetical protein
MIIRKMDRKDMATYHSGFEYKVTTPITKQVFVGLIDELTEAFGAGWKFVTEPITEGGIEITNWPGKLPKHYKTLRLLRRDWPTITPNWREEWCSSSDVLLDVTPTKDSWNGTFLKAFHGAPAWSQKEIDMFIQVFESHGMIIRKKKLRKC